MTPLLRREKKGPARKREGISSLSTPGLRRRRGSRRFPAPAVYGVGPVAVFCLFATLFFHSPAWSEMYKWTDKNGKSHFTDDRGKIPPEYRSQIKTLKESRRITEPPSSSVSGGGAGKESADNSGFDDPRFKNDRAQLQQILDNAQADVAEKIMDAQKFLAETTGDYAKQAKEYAAQGNDYLDKAKATPAGPAPNNETKTPTARELRHKGEALLEKSKLYLDKSRELEAVFQKRAFEMAKEQAAATAEQMKNRQKEMAEQIEKMEKY